MSKPLRKIETYKFFTHHDKGSVLNRFTLIYSDTHSFHATHYICLPINTEKRLGIFFGLFDMKPTTTYISGSFGKTSYTSYIAESKNLRLRFLNFPKNNSFQIFVVENETGLVVNNKFSQYRHKLNEDEFVSLVNKLIEYHKVLEEDDEKS